MRCPNCQSPNVMRGETIPLHLFRLLTLSHKCYCPDCKHKWRARPKNNGAGTAVLAVAILISCYFGFGLAESLFEKWKSSKLGQQATAVQTVLSDKKLMTKIQSAGGNPQKVLQQLSANEKDKIKNLVLSSNSNNDDIQERLRGMGIQVDSAMLSKIARFKSNPKAALQELTPEEKARAKSELAKANIDPKSIK